MSLLTAAELSAAEVARELDLTQANASYHLRMLADVGLIEEHGTEKVRGGVAKKYRYTGAQSEGAAPEPASVQELQESFPMIAAALASELQRRSLAYQPNADDEPDNVYADLETWIDPEVWREVTELVIEASRIAHRNALPSRTEGAIPVSMVTSLFRMQPPEAREGRAP